MSQSTIFTKGAEQNGMPLAAGPSCSAQEQNGSRFEIRGWRKRVRHAKERLGVSQTKWLYRSERLGLEKRASAFLTSKKENRFPQTKKKKESEPWCQKDLVTLTLSGDCRPLETAVGRHPARASPLGWD